MLTGIVVSHGTLCDAFVESIQKIVGPVDCLEAISNEGFSLRDLTAHLKTVMEKYCAAEGFIFMVEFKGGSGFMAAKKAAHEFMREPPPGSKIGFVGIITGVNMPMLITFVTKRDSLEPADLLNLLKEEGIRGITVDQIITVNGGT